MVLATDQSIAPFLTAYARIHYICYYSILANSSDAFFKQMKQIFLREYHPDKLGGLGDLFSASRDMQLLRPIDYVYECLRARRQLVQVRSVTEKLIKITCESFFELVDGNEYAIWISS